MQIVEGRQIVDSSDGLLTEFQRFNGDCYKKDGSLLAEIRYINQAGEEKSMFCTDLPRMLTIFKNKDDVKIDLCKNALELCEKWNRDNSSPGKCIRLDLPRNSY